MGTEFEGEERSTSHLDQDERGFARCPAERRLRCGLRREVPADMKPSHRRMRGEGVNS
jgi:hypothetical protein